jgi:hypothetical protein
LKFGSRAGSGSLFFWSQIFGSGSGFVFSEVDVLAPNPAPKFVGAKLRLGTGSGSGSDFYLVLCSTTSEHLPSKRPSDSSM